MDTFFLYFRLGFEHILDPGGFDHMLFLAVLCAGYPATAWRRILLLATAFTLGHSITLGMGAMGWSLLPSTQVEWLIAFTIFLTAAYTFFRKSDHESRTWPYLAALGFGLIHGMGFATQFTMLEAESRLLLTWLPFNLGIEAGQLLFVAALMLVGWDLQRHGGLSLSYWRKRLALLAALISLWMMWERIWW